MDWSCYELGVKLLTIREHSEYELKTKMSKKDFSEEELDSTIEKLKELGFQSNERYAEAFIRSRYNQGKGPIKIRSELSQRRVDHYNLDEHDWYELSKSVYEKKYNREDSIDSKEKSKRMRFMQSRGFDFEQINYAMEDRSND